MKITQIETLHCDAGWRNYNFVKVSTDEGIVGWSEFDETLQSAGLTGVIKRLAPRAIGMDAMAHEKVFQNIFAPARSSFGSVVTQACAAIENALLDVKAKKLGVPCYEILGGKIRDKVDVYWSHCATWRIFQPHVYKPAITSLDGVKQIGREVKEKGFKACKTNLMLYGDDGKPTFWMPGFGRPLYPELNVPKKVIKDLRAHLEALRDGCGPDVGILLDLNFNCRTEGYLEIIRSLADFDLFWVELDTFDWKAQRFIRDHCPHPISGLETLVDMREFIPFMNEQSVDVAIIDLPWNGVWQSLKIAALCEAHEVNVAPHNYYGHLCSMMAIHFSAAVPNLRIMEIDVDRIPWEDELFTHKPEIVDGQVLVPNRPGWGTEPNEAGLRAHPPKAY